MAASSSPRRPPQREHVLVAVLGKFSDATPLMRFAVLVVCLCFVIAAIAIGVLHPQAGVLAGGGSLLWGIGRLFDRW